MLMISIVKKKQDHPNDGEVGEAIMKGRKVDLRERVAHENTVKSYTVPHPNAMWCHQFDGSSSHKRPLTGWFSTYYVLTIINQNNNKSETVLSAFDGRKAMYVRGENIKVWLTTHDNDVSSVITGSSTERCINITSLSNTNTKSITKNNNVHVYITV